MFNIYVQTEGEKIVSFNANHYEITSDGWYLVYSGEEEAAPNLFPKGIMSEKGGFNYALVDGEIVERSAEEIKADEEAANPTPKQNEQIAEGDVTFDEMATAIMEGVNEV